MLTFLLERPKKHNRYKGGQKMFELMPWKKREQNDLVQSRLDFDDLVNRFFGRDFWAPGDLLREDRWFPSVDITEGKKEITVKAEIPGVEAKDIDITISGKMLTIKGEKKQEKEEKEENFHRMERSYGYFNRTIELPCEVDSEKVDASYKKGVLKIELKKTKESESRRIEIKS
jgi:HSP20 family protein